MVQGAALQGQGKLLYHVPHRYALTNLKLVKEAAQEHLENTAWQPLSVTAKHDWDR